MRRYCALEDFETRTLTFSGLVVPYFSGVSGCETSAAPDTVYADHSRLVKPSARKGYGNEAYLILLRNYQLNPYHEVRLQDDSTRDKREYLEVGCNHTKSDNAFQVAFELNPFYDEEVVSATARLENTDKIKDISPNPPEVRKVARGTVEVKFGFNGESAGFFSGCPGGGHATLVVHPIIRARIPIPDGEQ